MLQHRAQGEVATWPLRSLSLSLADAVPSPFSAALCCIHSPSHQSQNKKACANFNELPPTDLLPVGLHNDPKPRE